MEPVIHVKRLVENFAPAVAGESHRGSNCLNKATSATGPVSEIDRDNETIYQGRETFDSPTIYYEGNIGENVTDLTGD
jgi:hypothetical protein